MNIYAFGEVGYEVILKDIISQIKSSSEKDLNILINSPGGSVDEGYAIHDYLVDLSKQGYNVTTEVFGQCASIATVIFLAGKERVINENSSFMIHNPWGMPMGDHKEIQKYADMLKETESKLAQFYSTKTGGNVDEIRQMMDEETYLTADEAVNMGFATSMKEATKAVAKFKTKTNKMNKQKSIVSKIQSLMKGLLGETKALETTLADGTAIFIETEGETPNVGDLVYVGDALAPDGTHELASGESIVTVDGAITEVVAAMEEDDEDYKALYEAASKERDEAIAALEGFEKNLQALKAKTTQSFSMKRTFKAPAKEGNGARFSKSDIKPTKTK